MQKTLYILFFLVLLITSSLAQETFLSLKKNKVNVRYGPSFDSDIKYVYKKINLPIKQIDKKENFRRIIDLKNPIAQIKKGRLLILQKCEDNWCKIKSNDFEGWIKNEDIWGLIN